MGIVTISIKDFDDAIKECGNAYSEANAYKGELTKKVLNKINAYSGSWSTNVRNAYNNVNGKCKDLSNKMEAISKYQTDITNLRNGIVNAENTLATRIESLVNNFCNKHELRTEQTFFEWLFGNADWLNNIREFFKSFSVNVKNWYRYDGGREVINVIGAVVAVAIAVIGLALASGFAAVALAVIGLATALVQLGYAVASVWAAKSGDPVWARRYETHSENETAQSTLRRMGAYEIAFAVDVINIAASIVSIATSIFDFGKGIFKAGGFKNFIKQGFKNFKNNLKYLTTRPEVIKDFFLGDKKKTWSTIKTGLSIVKSSVDLVENLAKGEGASALLTFAGSTLDTITGYLWKLSEKDLWSCYAADSALGKNLAAKDKFLKTHQDKVLTQDEFDELNKIQYKIDGFTKYADMLTTKKDKLSLGTSFSTFKSLAKNGIKLAENIESLYNLSTLDQLNFKYDDGTRMEYASWLKDWVKPVTSWEKFVPKVYDKVSAIA